MVDVSAKKPTDRMARAAATVHMAKETMDKIRAGRIGKGDVLAVAQVAGIMAAKKNSELIPMCHPLGLTKVDISFALEETALQIRSEVRCHGETGVEMEALTAASVAALTVYDMCKAVQKDMRIDGIRLLHKEGGKSGVYDAPGEPDAGERSIPSADAWLAEAKAAAANCGMYLLHNGVVRPSARAFARDGDLSAPPVAAMLFDYEETKVREAVRAAEAMPGIECVRVWLNRGRLSVGDDIMYVLVGGDIRPRVKEALFTLVSELKTKCVSEQELSE